MASEETTSVLGNDYEAILDYLAYNHHAVNEALLAARIVDAFGQTYSASSATLSAVGLTGTGWPELIAALHELADVILAADQTTLIRIKEAAAFTRHYYYPENKDLADFARLLLENLSDKPALANAAAKIETLLLGPEVVTRLACTGSLADGRTHGLAIFLPTTAAQLSDYPQYGSLRFSSLTGWDEAVTAIVGAGE